MNSADQIDQRQFNPATLFRYQAVSAVLARQAAGEVRTEAIKAVAEQMQVDLNGHRQRISQRSVYRWLKAYDQEGIKGLYPKDRARKKQLLNKDLTAYLKGQKETDPAASIPELLARAKMRGLIEAGEKVSRTTAWRALRESGVATRRGKTGKRALTRRFAFHHRMEMVLCDGKHFRVGVARCKRVVLFFLDDATRMVLSAVVGPSETTVLFLRGLHQCLCRYGMMKRLFLDNGSAFISKDSHHVAAALGIHLIHGSVGYPEGRGKVERFHRTAWDALLRHFDGNPSISANHRSLELRIHQYVTRTYHHNPHEGLHRQSPHTRFHQDSLPLNLALNMSELNGKFIIDHQRKVGRDHIVSLDGKAYEVPPGYAGTKIILSRHVLTGEVSMRHRSRQITLGEVDLAGNARRGPNPSATTGTVKPPFSTSGDTHAQLQFENDFQPLVDAKGNHFENKETDHA